MSQLLASLRIHVLPTKVEEIRRLEASILINGGSVAHDPEAADVIVTALKGRARMALTLSKRVMNTKPLLMIRWLEDSFVHMKLLDYRTYLVPQEDHPDPTDLCIPHALELTEEDSDASSISSQESPPPSPTSLSQIRRTSPHKRTRSPSPSADSPMPAKLARLGLDTPKPLPHPDTFDFHPRTAPHLIPPPGSPMDPASMAKLACQRISPIVCVNQGFLDELNVIIKWKEIGEDGMDLTADKHDLALKRAASSIKAYPTVLKSASEARKLPNVGEKVELLLKEYLKTGKLARADELREDPRLRCLLLFKTIHGIGSKVARELYDRFDCRTLEDVYTAKPAFRMEVEYWGEIQSRMDRREVEEVAEYIHATLETISPGCKYTICGGYRRGKPTSADVDLVFTHPSGDANRVSRNMLDRLIEQMTSAGAVKELVSGAHIGDGGRRTTTVNHSFFVLRLPGEGRLHRRVDVIFAAYSVYWCTVIGWSGSLVFERDLRRYAKNMDLKFDSSGLRNRVDDSLVLVDPASGERGVFERLGLEWTEPTERCADI